MPGGPTHELHSTEAEGAVSARHARYQRDPLTFCRARKREWSSEHDMPRIIRISHRLQKIEVGRPLAHDMPRIDRICSPTAEHGSGRCRQHTTSQGSAGSAHRLRSMKAGGTVSAQHAKFTKICSPPAEGGREEPLACNMSGISRVHSRPTEHGRGRGLSIHIPGISKIHSHPSEQRRGRGCQHTHQILTGSAHSLRNTEAEGPSAHTCQRLVGSTHVLQNTGGRCSQRTRITQERQHSLLTHKDGKYIKHDCITLTPPSLSNFGIPLIVLRTSAVSLPILKRPNRFTATDIARSKFNCCTARSITATASSCKTSAVASMRSSQRWPSLCISDIHNEWKNKNY